jgi:photosystem II stability/assembly factor-like uncharacterized protein
MQLDRKMRSPLALLTIVGTLAVCPVHVRSVARESRGNTHRQSSPNEAISTVKEVLPLDVRAFVILSDGSLIAVGNRNLDNVEPSKERRGLVAKSVDDGLSWRVTFFGRGYILIDCAFRDSTHGIIVGKSPQDSTVVLRTTDGGDNWEEIYRGDADDVFEDVVTFGRDYYAVSFRGLPIRLIDGDRVRTLARLPNEFEMWSIAVSATGHLWSIGVREGKDWMMLESIDDGASWALCQNLTGDTAPGWRFKSISIYSVFFVNASNGYIVADGIGSKDSSRGSNEAKTRGLLYRTRNGGKTWEQRVVYCDGGIVDLHRLPNGDMVALPIWPHGGCYVRSKDGGSSWMRVPLSPQVSAGSLIRFADETHGWIVGGNDLSGMHPRPLYRTTDGGKTWGRMALTWTEIRTGDPVW